MHSRVSAPVQMRCSRRPSPPSKRSVAAAFAACSPKSFFRRDEAIAMTELLLKMLASYLLGSLIGSLIVGRVRGGVDIRTLGSGNAGGTNALRTQGKSFALWVMLIDIGKGIVATR